MTEERDENQEPNFEVIDRRRVSAQGEPAAAEQPTPTDAKPEEPPTAESAEPSQAGAAEEAEAEPAAEARAMTAEDIITMSIGLLQQQAWVSMGLVMNPVTKAVNKDLEQAKLAIDAVAALVNLIAPGLDDDLQRDLRAIVSDLQVNFVQQQ